MCSLGCHIWVTFNAAPTHTRALSLFLTFLQPSVRSSSTRSKPTPAPTWPFPLPPAAKRPPVRVVRVGGWWCASLSPCCLLVTKEGMQGRHPCACGCFL